MRCDVPQTARIDIRTDPQRKKVIVRAAALTNTDVTRFILDRVVPDAERIVAEKEGQKIRLPPNTGLNSADTWTKPPRTCPGCASC